MTFAGLSGAAFAAISGVSLAVIVALYLLKLRRPRVVVAFAQLWQAALAQGEHRSLFDRLRAIFSLLLSAALAMLLITSLADPRPSHRRGSPSKTVLVLDASASMMARSQGGTALFDLAVADAKRVAASATTTGEVAAVLAATEAEPLSAFTDDLAELSAGLSKAGPVCCGSDLTAGVRYARAVLLGTEKSQVVIFTDRNLNERESRLLAGIPFEIRGVERAGANAGLARFSVRRLRGSPADVEGLLTVVCSPASGERLLVRIEEDSSETPRLLDIVEIGAATEAATKTFRLVLPSRSKLRASLSFADGRPYRDVLTADDVAYACLDAARSTRVLVVGRERPNFFLARSLAANPFVEAEWMEADDYRKGASSRPAAAADVIIFDGVLPPAEPKGAAIFLNPPAASDSRVAVRVIDTVVFPRVGNILPSHPVMRGLALSDVNIESASVVETAPGDVILARSAVEPMCPLMLLRPFEGHWRLVVAFDMTATELPLRLEFPLLVSNALQFLAGAPEESSLSAACGVPIEMPAPPGLNAAELKTPEGTTVDLPVALDKIAFIPLSAGFYTVRAGQSERVFAASLADEAETRAQGAPPGRPVRPSVLIAAGSRRPWAILALLAFAGLALEWFTYNRRMTV